MSNQIRMRKRYLHVPRPQELADAIRDGLINFYTDVDVKCVSCPNLTVEPFHLAAPGLGGDPAFVEVGNLSYIETSALTEKAYDFADILVSLDRHSSQSFIFGNGIHQHPKTKELSELVMNTSFLPKTNGEMEIRNRSCIIFPLTEPTRYPKMLTNSELKHTLQGSFFLCKGIKGPVLKVRAKRIGLSSSSDLIDSMQAILQRTFGSAGRNVVLGGVCTTWNLKKSWQHKLIPNSWENWTASQSGYCNINTPETIISTFNSTNGQMSFSSKSPIILNGCKSIHSLSHHSSAQNNLLDVFDMEFLGYFRPAETLYIIDEPHEPSDLTTPHNS